MKTLEDRHTTSGASSSSAPVELTSQEKDQVYLTVVGGITIFFSLFLHCSLNFILLDI